MEAGFLGAGAANPSLLLSDIKLLGIGEGACAKARL